MVDADHDQSTDRKVCICGNSTARSCFAHADYCTSNRTGKRYFTSGFNWAARTARKPVGLRELLVDMYHACVKNNNMGTINNCLQLMNNIAFTVVYKISTREKERIVATA